MINEVIVFGFALFCSVTTIMSFVGDMMTGLVNKINARYGASFVLLFITTVLWCAFYAIVN